MPMNDCLDGEAMLGVPSEDCTVVSYGAHQLHVPVTHTGVKAELRSNPWVPSNGSI